MSVKQKNVAKSQICCNVRKRSLEIALPLKCAACMRERRKKKQVPFPFEDYSRGMSYGGVVMDLGPQGPLSLHVCVALILYDAWILLFKMLQCCCYVSIWYMHWRWCSLGMLPPCLLHENNLFNPCDMMMLKCLLLPILIPTWKNKDLVLEVTWMGNARCTQQF